MLNIFTVTGFILLNLMVLASALIFSMHLLNYEVRDHIKLLLYTFTIFVSEIVCFQITLGIFGYITYLNIILLSSFVFCFSLPLIYKNKNKIHITPREKGSFNIPLLFVAFSPIALVLFVRLFNAFLQIPLEYDSVAYHLPFVVEWLNTGNLRELYYSAFATPISYYPSNYELIDLWVMIPFRQDLFVNLVNFPLFIVFGISFYAVLRNLSISKNISLVSSALLLSMPVMFRQAGLPLVDLFFITLFVLSIYFLQEAYKSKNKLFSHATLFGLTLGLFVGTKYLGIVYAAPLLLMSILIFKKYFPFSLFAIFITGSFFYLRNWINSGNPLFPVDISIGSWKIFEGYPGVNEAIGSTSLLSNVHSLHTLKEFISKYFLVSGWQSVMIAAGGILTVIFFIYLLVNRKKGSKNDLTTAFFIIIGTLIYLGLYIKSPYSYRDLIPNVRYSMPFLVLGILNVSFIASRIKSLRTPFFISSIFSILFSLIFLIVRTPSELVNNNRMHLDFGLALDHKMLFGYLLLALITLAVTAIPSKRRAIFAILFITFLGIFSTKSFVARENLIEYSFSTWYNTDENALGLMQGAMWLNANAPDSNIAYTGFNFHYQLFGRNLQRQVDYININPCRECRYIDYKNAPASIRSNPDYSAWIENLKEKDKEYLVIQPLVMEQVHSYELEWASQHPEKFQEVFNSQGTIIYKILS